VTPAGTISGTNQPCPTTRDFRIVDQDPSDNVTTKYLLTANGQTAQFSQANAAALQDATPIGNGSDNALLDRFVDPALGCTPLQAPDLSQGGAMGTSQALDELSAAASQQPPVALVPENDPMVLVNNAFGAAKTNLYRANIGQPPVARAPGSADSPAGYCQNMVNVQAPFLSASRAMLEGSPSPVTDVGTNLFTFMANRLSMSFANLNCANFGLTDPVTLTLDANGVATDATFSTAQQTATGGAGMGQRMPRQGHRHGSRLFNPSGM
jgi:hypothetical protein